MITYLTTDMNWVLGLRNPILTSFFKFFPFFASDLFYLGFVSCGYWGWNRPIFKGLGVLACVCTLLNVALKEVIDLPRPAIEHLVDTHGTGGFPSGDIQVAIAFWILLISSLKKHYLWYFAAPLVTLIGLSRLYLGVHSPLDILGGLVIGVLYTKGHIIVVHSSFWDRLQERTTHYVLGILLAYGIYFYIVPIQKYGVCIPAGGCLLGIIIATWVEKRSPLPFLPSNKQTKLIAITGGIFSTIALRYCIKLIPGHPLFPFTKSLAFALLAIYIFYIWPKVAHFIYPEKGLKKHHK